MVGSAKDLVTKGSHEGAYLASFDRVSAGVHSDVGADEARALVLQTYLLLGELLLLPTAAV